MFGRCCFLRWGTSWRDVDARILAFPHFHHHLPSSVARFPGPPRWRRHPAIMKRALVTANITTSLFHLLPKELLSQALLAVCCAKCVLALDVAFPGLLNDSNWAAYVDGCCLTCPWPADGGHSVIHADPLLGSGQPAGVPHVLKTDLQLCHGCLGRRLKDSVSVMVNGRRVARKDQYGLHTLADAAHPGWTNSDAGIHKPRRPRLCGVCLKRREERPFPWGPSRPCRSAVVVALAPVRLLLRAFPQVRQLLGPYLDGNRGRNWLPGFIGRLQQWVEHCSSTLPQFTQRAFGSLPTGGVAKQAAQSRTAHASDVATLVTQLSDVEATAHDSPGTPAAAAEAQPAAVRLFAVFDPAQLLVDVQAMPKPEHDVAVLVRILHFCAAEQYVEAGLQAFFSAGGGAAVGMGSSSSDVGSAGVNVLVETPVGGAAAAADSNAADAGWVAPLTHLVSLSTDARQHVGACPAQRHCPQRLSALPIPDVDVVCARAQDEWSLWQDSPLFSSGDVFVRFLLLGGTPSAVRDLVALHGLQFVSIASLPPVGTEMVAWRVVAHNLSAAVVLESFSTGYSIASRDRLCDSPARVLSNVGAWRGFFSGDRVTDEDVRLWFVARQTLAADAEQADPLKPCRCIVAALVKAGKTSSWIDARLRDSSLISAYVGRTDRSLTLDYVISVMLMVTTLMAESHIAYSRLHAAGKCDIMRCVYQNRQDPTYTCSQAWEGMRSTYESRARAVRLDVEYSRMERYARSEDSYERYARSDDSYDW